MFDITCPTCQIRTLRTTRAIEAFVNTPDGPMAVLQCHEGHRVVRSFHLGTTQLLVDVSTDDLELAS